MTGNLLIHGGNENALRTLNDTGQYRGRVKSAYLRPPWDTKWGFEHHEALGRASWLGMMQAHLRLVRDLLAPDGSVWVHVDDWQFADCRAHEQGLRPIELRIHSRRSEACTMAPVTSRSATTTYLSSRKTPRHGSRTFSLVQPDQSRVSATLTTIPAGRGEQPTCPPLCLVRTCATKW